MANYPRVNINTVAKPRDLSRPAAQDTTVLFMPLITKKGPVKELTPIHSLAKFIEVFGELDFELFELNGQSAMNAYNWLVAGGTLYVYRLEYYTKSAEYKVKYTTGEGASATVNREKLFDAKYPGPHYKDVTVEATVKGSGSNSSVYVVVKENGNRMESFFINANNFGYVLESGSRFIKFTAGLEFDTFKTKVALGTIETSIEEETDAAKAVTIDELVEAFYESTGEDAERKAIDNRLVAPIDIIMDAGYAKDTKDAIDEFRGIRNDIIYIMDEFDFKNGTELSDEDEDYPFTKPSELETTNVNLAVYKQHFEILDEIFSNKTQKVSPTYFLSKLIPFNDLTYGVQYPTAGLRRGILEDAIGISKNPDSSTKDTWFDGNYNYAEKSSREYAFMNQRMFSGWSIDNFNALSFLNNVRALQKMKKELERLGREYLFEFNDSVTLAQLSTVLNRYMSEWVANRTLNLAVVNVEKNEFSQEAVDIFLNIRFTNTIEVITVDVTIE